MIWGAVAAATWPAFLLDREFFTADVARMGRTGVKPKFVAAECGHQRALPRASAIRANGVKSLARRDCQRKFPYGYASN